MQSLMPKGEDPVSNTPPPSSGSGTPSGLYVQNSGSGVKIPILFGAVLALVAACGYLFYELSQVRNELAQTRESLSAEIEKIHETSSVSTQTSKRTVETLKEQIDKYRAQAAALSGEAKNEANRHADELAARLEKVQSQQGQKLSEVGTEVTEVKGVAAATSTKVGEVSADVGTLKTETASNRSDIEKTIADLKSARGDLGVQSGLIATNGKELAALKQLGERNYTEFKLAKTKAPQKVGDISVLLKSADPKRNKFTIVIVADDKTVEKKDRTVNEPVQFLLSKAVQPYELVVNDVKKDLISGYLAAPKVQHPRGSSN